MIDQKVFKRTVASSLENSGLVKNGRQSWYLHGKDIIIVINLQKSNWNELYYINIGIWLNALGEASFPLHNHCHLHYRVESLFPRQRELIYNGCYLEKGNIELLKDLTTFIESELSPLLQECTNEARLKELFSQGSMENGLVTVEARRYLTSRESIP